VTPAQRIANELSRRFNLNVAWILKASAYREGIEQALRFMSEEKIIAVVVDQGTLRRATNPYGALFARVRAIPGDADAVAHLGSVEAEALHFRSLDNAARIGTNARALVDRGELFLDEAREQIEKEFQDEARRAIALAALDGGAT
jgi:hypothetical protein